MLYYLLDYLQTIRLNLGLPEAKGEIVSIFFTGMINTWIYFYHKTTGDVFVFISLFGPDEQK